MKVTCSNQPDKVLEIDQAEFEDLRRMGFDPKAVTEKKGQNSNG